MKTTDVKTKKVITKTLADTIASNDTGTRDIKRALLGDQNNPVPKAESLVDDPAEAATLACEVAEYKRLSEEQRANEKRLAALKEKFLKTIIANGIPGDVGFTTPSGRVTFREQTRESLSEDKLLTKLSADEISECRVKGQPYFVVMVR